MLKATWNQRYTLTRLDQGENARQQIGRLRDLWDKAGLRTESKDTVKEGWRHISIAHDEPFVGQCSKWQRPAC